MKHKYWYFFWFLLVCMLTVFSTHRNQTFVNEGQLTNQTKTMIKESDKETMIAIFENLRQAMIDRDRASLECILPNDFVALHITGQKQSKNEWISDIINKKMIYYIFSDSHYAFFYEGRKVRMHVRQKIHAKIYGIEGTWQIPGDYYFQKNDDQWKLIS